MFQNEDEPCSTFARLPKNESSFPTHQTFWAIKKKKKKTKTASEKERKRGRDGGEKEKIVLGQVRINWNAWRQGCGEVARLRWGPGSLTFRRGARLFTCESWRPDRARPAPLSGQPPRFVVRAVWGKGGRLGCTWCPLLGPARFHYWPTDRMHNHDPSPHSYLQLYIVYTWRTFVKIVNIVNFVSILTSYYY